MDSLQVAIMRARSITFPVTAPPKKPQATTSESAPFGKPIPPSYRAIQRAVITVFGLTMEALLSPCRSRNLVWPRQISMWLSWKLKTKGHVEVGRMHNRDHTTSIHACGAVTRKLWNPDNETVNKINEILGLLRRRGFVVPDSVDQIPR